MSIEAEFKRKVLFNPDGDDSLSSRRLINGSGTNILNLNSVKYAWSTEYWREMTGNFWLPEKIDLTMDKIQYPELNPHDVHVYDHSLSFLTYLDSTQVENLPNIFAYITAPEVSVLGTLQGFQEAIHSSAYAYTFESVLPAAKRQSIYYFWRDNKILLERNKHIASIYQDFIDNGTFFNFYKVLIANLVLEGIYFYNGFTYFYNLESRNQMMGTATNIRLINRDELTHTRLFGSIIKTLNQEEIGHAVNFDYESLIYEMVDASVNEEVKYTDYIMGNRIPGMNSSSTLEYTRFLGNKVLKLIDMPPLYTANNPYSYLEKSFGDNMSGVRGNFFESNITEYKMSSMLTDWDLI